VDIIQIPEERALVQLSSIEIRALWKAFNRAREEMDATTFLHAFELSADRANGLAHKLSDALDIARRNVPD